MVLLKIEIFQDLNLRFKYFLFRFPRCHCTRSFVYIATVTFHFLSLVHRAVGYSSKWAAFKR